MSCSNCPPPFTGPTPHYDQPISVAAEDHRQFIYQSVHSPAILIFNDWNIPRVGETTILKVPGVINILVGSYLYNGEYGYFQIIGFNANTSELVIKNTGVSGTQSAGKYVPEATNFICSAAPCCSSADNIPYPFVAEDFTAPAQDAIANVKVTTVATLISDVLFRIGSGVYRITAINSGNEIVIVNEGAGISEGEVVRALDSDGRFQLPVTQVLTNACTNAPVTQGALLACSNGNQVLLDGTYPGQVPILQNASTNSARFGFLDAEVRTCTQLLSSVTFVTGTSEYTIQVQSTTGFQLGDRITIGFTTARFVINNILSSTQLLISPIVDTVLTLPIGTFVCRVLSTEELGTQLTVALADEIEDRIAGDNASIAAVNAEISARVADVNTEEAARIAADNAEAATRAAAITAEATARTTAFASQRLLGINQTATMGAPVDLTTTGASTESGELSFTYNNDSDNNMILHYTFDMFFDGDLVGASGYSATVDFLMSLGFNVQLIGALTDPGYTDDVVPYRQPVYVNVHSGVTSRPVSRHISRTVCIVLAAGYAIWLRGRGKVILSNKDSATKFTVSNIKVSLQGMGVGLET